MEPAAEAKVVQFVSEMLQGNDASHDAHHALAVYRNAQVIADDLALSSRDRLVAFVAALTHDCADHKYADAERKREALAKFLEDMFPGVQLLRS